MCQKYSDIFFIPKEEALSVFFGHEQIEQFGTQYDIDSLIQFSWNLLGVRRQPMDFF